MKRPLLFIIIFFSIDLLAQPSIDGDMTDASYTTLATYTSGRDGGGANNDLGVVKYYSDGNYLYIGITGETAGYGCIVLFLDFSGYSGRGYNTLKGSGVNGNSVFDTMLDGAKMDNGFDPDFAFSFTEANGNDFYINGVRFNSSGYQSAGSVGSWTNDQSGGSHSIDGSSVTGGSGVWTVAYNNSYSSNSNKGLELKIPFSAFPGVSGNQSLKIFTFLTGPYEFSQIYNECIPGDPGASNLGTDFDFGSVSGQTFYSEISVTPLPVELISFAASYFDGKVLLNWQTATEVNNYGFAVERSAVSSQLTAENREPIAKSWTKIGFVQGHGNSNSPKNYTFYDVSPLSGTVQYRLKQIDFDGKFEYSDIVETDVEAPANFALNQNHPNPFNPETTISYKVQAASQISLKVYDVLGTEVATLVDEFKQPGVYNSTFSTLRSSLSSGVYFYTLTTGGFSSTKKMLLMK